MKTVDAKPVLGYMFQLPFSLDIDGMHRKNVALLKIMLLSFP